MASNVVGFVFSDNSFFNAVVTDLEISRLTGEHGTWFSAMLAGEMASKYGITVSSSQLESIEMGGKYIDTVETGQLYQVSTLERAEDKSSMMEDERNYWNHSSVLMLIQIYQDKKHLFETSKKKMEVWKIISQELAKKGIKQEPNQCEKKFSNLKQRYKAVKDHNSHTGRNRQSWRYYGEMESLFGQDPAVVPPLTISSLGGPEEKEKSNPPKDPKRKLFQTPETEKPNNIPTSPELPVIKRKKQKTQSKTPEWFKEWSENSNRILEGILAETKRKNDLLEKLIEKL